MRHLAFLFAGLLALAGCSEGISNDPVPEDPEGVWMLDTFTWSRAGEIGLSQYLGIQKLVFGPDGTGVGVSVSQCGSSTHETELVWEHRAGDTIAIVASPHFGSDSEEWLLTPRNTCSAPGVDDDGVEEISLDEMRDGSIFDSSVLYRADICLARYEDETCPEGFECDDCQTVWCGAPPEPCQL